MSESTLYPHEILVKHLEKPAPIRFTIFQIYISFLVIPFVMILVVIADPYSVSKEVVPWINLGLNVACDLAVFNAAIGIISFLQFVRDLL